MANDVKETIERIETANTVLDEVVEEYPDLFEDVEVSVDNHGEELTVSADLPQTRTFGEAVDAATRVAEEFRSYEVVEAVSICVDEKHYDSDEERMVVGDPVPRFNALF